MVRLVQVIFMNIGKRISELRKKKGLSQEELAKYLYVSDKTISSWEMGRTEPSLDLIVKLTCILECEVSYLIYGDDVKSDVETEIKIKLSEAEAKSLDDILENCSLYLGESHQVDTYYQPKYRPFLCDNDGDVEEWLRIGLRGNKKILNYKHWYQNKYCDEFEVTIDDEKKLDKIFKVLDLEVIAVVDKMRKKYMYKNKYEVSLDYVESLGYFVEIEVKEYSLSPLMEYDLLIEVVKYFGLKIENVDKRGYPYHIIYNKMKKSI